MSLPSCSVHCIFKEDTGDAIEGAVVSARLSTYEVYQGYVVPTIVEGVTNAAGLVTLALWPNDLGNQGSHYAIKISLPNGKSFRVNALIPSMEEVNLHDIATFHPYIAVPV